jgi:hypothetical protein
MTDSVLLTGSCPASVRRFSLTFSGGGKRAALFALGGLFALVESGEHKAVRSITSVSGGSMTNAVIASQLDLANSTADEFVAVAAPYFENLCKRPHRFPFLAIFLLWLVLVYLLVFPKARNSFR